MWIRSQDKRKLLKVDNIKLSHYERCPNPNYDIETATELGISRLGVYSTKEKALKVLDMIQKFIGTNDVFQMPQDSEV